ncbi:MAG: glutathione S-transferase [Mariprofundus sp.]
MTVSKPVLYSFRRCPYAMRARMALHYAGVQCMIREVVLKDKPQQLLAISAKGTVPVLLLPDGNVIDESLEIMRWALARHDPELWLQADAGNLIERNDSEFKFHLDRYKYPERFGLDSDAVSHRQQATVFLAELDQYLSQAAYLYGERASMADIALFPFVRQFAAVQPAWFAALPYPHLQTWLSRWLDSELFHAVMLRYPQWHPEDGDCILS